MNIWKIGCGVLTGIAGIFMLAYVGKSSDCQNLEFSNKLYEISTGLQKVTIEAQQEVIENLQKKDEEGEEAE